MHLSDQEMRCLGAWEGIGEEYCLNFKGVTRRAAIDPKEVRPLVRSLAGKGLLYFQRGLFDEVDGTVAGSGYGLTKSGSAALAKIDARGERT